MVSASQRDLQKERLDAMREALEVFESPAVSSLCSALQKQHYDRCDVLDEIAHLRSVIQKLVGRLADFMSSSSVSELLHELNLDVRLISLPQSSKGSKQLDSALEVVKLKLSVAEQEVSDCRAFLSERDQKIAEQCARITNLEAKLDTLQREVCRSDYRADQLWTVLPQHAQNGGGCDKEGLMVFTSSVKTCDTARVADRVPGSIKVRTSLSKGAQGLRLDSRERLL